MSTISRPRLKAQAFTDRWQVEIVDLTGTYSAQCWDEVGCNPRRGRTLSGRGVCRTSFSSLGV